LDGLDLDRLIGVEKEFFEQEPHTFADLRPLISELEPGRDQSALAYAARTRLPLVQVPSGGVWGYSGKAPFTTPDRWGGGIGGRLVDAILTEARTRGYDRAQLWTQTDNARARRLYEGRGFGASGREKEESGEPIVHYVRALPEIS